MFGINFTITRMTDEEILQLDFYDFCGIESINMSDEEKIKWYRMFMGLMTKNYPYTKVSTDIPFNEMTTLMWVRILTYVSNGFIGKEDTLSFKREKDYYYIHTGLCDDVSIVKVYCKIGEKGITKIERLGDDPDGWKEVHQETYNNIEKFLKEKYEKAESNRLAIYRDGTPN